MENEFTGLESAEKAFQLLQKKLDIQEENQIMAQQSHKERIFNSDQILLEEKGVSPDKNKVKYSLKIAQELISDPEDLNTEEKYVESKKRKKSPKRDAVWRSKNRNLADYEFEFCDYLNKKREILAQPPPIIQRKFSPIKKIPQENCEDSDIVSQISQMSDFAYKNSAEIIENFQKIFEQQDQRPQKISRIKHQKDDEIYLLSYLYNQIRKKSLEKDLITKEDFYSYLLQNPELLNLYNIEPQNFEKMLSKFTTKQQNLVTRSEMILFLMNPVRNKLQQFSLQEVDNILQKKQKKIKLSKNVLKQEEQNEIIQCFVQLDTFGEHVISTKQLLQKLRNSPKIQGFISRPFLYVQGVNKQIYLERCLYELEQEMQHGDETQKKLRQTISWDQFLEFIDSYKRRDIPTKDKVIAAQKLSGKYDLQDQILISKEGLQFLKDIFDETHKREEYFVQKQEFYENIQESRNYYKFKNQEIRTEPYKDITKETFQNVLDRILKESDEFMDIDEIIDFFTKKGRPIHIQETYLLREIQDQQMRSQLEFSRQEIESSPEEKDLRDKRKSRKLEKICKKSSKTYDLQELSQKQSKSRAGAPFGALYKEKSEYKITAPEPFSFLSRQKKEFISSKKLRKWLESKQEEEDQAISMVGTYRASEVPKHVKDRNRYKYFQQFDEYRWAKISRDLDKRRREIHEQSKMLTLQNEKPFNFYLRDKEKQPKVHCWYPEGKSAFKANEIPWYSSVELLERMQREKEQKSAANIRDRIAYLTDTNFMPEEVLEQLKKLQKYEDLKKEREKQLLQSIYGQPLKQIRAKTVPNFAKLQKDFQDSMAERKKGNVQTKHKDFKFSESRKAPSRSYLDQENMFQRNANEMPKKPLSMVFKPPKLQPAATLKWEAQDDELKQLAEEEKLHKEEDKAFRREQFAKFVRSSAAIVDNSKQMEERRRELVEGKIKIQQDWEREFDEMMTGMMKRVIRRPLLVESQSSGNYGYDRLTRLKKLLGDQEIIEEDENEEDQQNQYNDMQQPILEVNEKLHEIDEDDQHGQQIGNQYNQQISEEQFQNMTKEEQEQYLDMMEQQHEQYQENEDEQYDQQQRNHSM